MPVDLSPDSEMEVDPEYTVKKRMDSDQHNCPPPDTGNKKSEHPDDMRSSSSITNESIHRFASYEEQRYEYGAYSVHRRLLTDVDPVPEFEPKELQKTIPMNRERICDQNCSIVMEKLPDKQHTESVELEVANALLSMPESMQASVRTPRRENIHNSLIGDVASFPPNEKLGQNDSVTIPERLSDKQQSESVDDGIEVTDALSTPESMQATARTPHWENIHNTLIGDAASFLPNETLGHNDGGTISENKVEELRESLENYASDEMSQMESLVSFDKENISRTLIGKDVYSFPPNETLGHNDGVTIPENKVEEFRESLENYASEEMSHIESLVSFDKESISHTLIGKDVTSFPPNEMLGHNDGVTISENKVQDPLESLENYASDEIPQMESLVILDKGSISQRPQTAKIARKERATELGNAEGAQKRKITEIYAAGKSCETGSVASLDEESISKRLRSSKKASKSSIPPLISSIKLRSRREGV